MARARKKSMHYPNLKTMLMVEKAIKDADQPVRRTALKKRMEKKVMHQTLNRILEYFSEKNMILDTHTGIIWLDKPNAKLAKALKEGLRL